jgi:hypothetical protein
MKLNMSFLPSLFPFFFSLSSRKVIFSNHFVYPKESYKEVHNIRSAPKFSTIFLHFEKRKRKNRSPNHWTTEKEKEECERNIYVDNRRVPKECTPSFLISSCFPQPSVTMLVEKQEE